MYIYVYVYVYVYVYIEAIARNLTLFMFLSVHGETEHSVFACSRFVLWGVSGCTIPCTKPQNQRTSAS